METVTIPKELWDLAITVLRRSPEQDMARYLQAFDAQQQAEAKAQSDETDDELDQALKG